MGKLFKNIFIFFSPSKVNVNGFEIFTYSREAPDFTSGEYEKKETEIFKKTVESNWVVLDGGANWGVHTITLSKLAKEVWAFEPSKKNFSLLEKNIEYNKCKNVKAINKALSEKTGIAMLEVSESAGSYKIGNKGKLEKIETVRGDEFNQNFDFIKLDIEGHELEALRGMENLLKKKPVLVVEYNPSILESPADFLDFLAGLGYRFFDIKADRNTTAKRLLEDYIDTHTNLLCK